MKNGLCSCNLVVNKLSGHAGRFVVCASPYRRNSYCVAWNYVHRTVVSLGLVCLFYH